MARQFATKVADVEYDRALHWAQFVIATLIEWQASDKSGSRIFIDKSSMAKMIGISTPTLNQWINGRGYPNREGALAFANAFNLKASEVLIEAGYDVGEEEESLMQPLFAAIDAQADVPQKVKDVWIAALQKLNDPAWRITNAHKVQSIQPIILRNMPAIEKAEIIASIVRGFATDLTDLDGE